MKKTFIIILTTLIIVMAILYAKYISYKSNLSEIKQNNQVYEYYLNKEVYANELATLINKAVDNNEKNKIPKDENGFYIEGQENSIKIQITTIDLDKDTTYNMESFYNSGLEKFYMLYREILFECTKIEYDSKGKVNYMLFVQRTT